MNFIIKPNFKEVGSKLGSKIKLYQDKLLKLTEEEISTLLNNETIIMDLDGEELTVNKEMIDIRIYAKEGFNVGMENNNFIILNTELNDSLIREGLAREIVSKVQNMRKSSGFDIADRIRLYYDGNNEILEAFKEYSQYIKDETLATVYENKSNDNKVMINDIEVFITIEKEID